MYLYEPGLDELRLGEPGLDEPELDEPEKVGFCIDTAQPYMFLYTSRKDLQSIEKGCFVLTHDVYVFMSTRSKSALR